MPLCHTGIYMYTNQNVLFKKIMSHRLYIFSDEDTSLATFFRTMFLHQTTQILTNNYMQHVSLQHSISSSLTFIFYRNCGQNRGQTEILKKRKIPKARSFRLSGSQIWRRRRESNPRAAVTPPKALAKPPLRPLGYFSMPKSFAPIEAT